MKHSQKIIIACALAITTFTSMHIQGRCATCTTCTSPVFIPRPQGLNSAALYNPFYYKCCDATIDASWTFNAGYRYERTWKGKRLAQCLFGCDTLNFEGQSVTEHNAPQFMEAENFGLSRYYSGSINFDPLIENHCIDFSGRYEFGSWLDCLDGLYGAINASLVTARWDLRACQTESKFQSVYPENPMLVPQCWQSTSAEETALRDIKTALSGMYSFGQLQNGPMKYGRFIFDKAQTSTQLANIDLLLGYDLVRCDGYHCGIFVKTVAPTGNRPNPETVFAPLIGNAHHWELGGGVDAHYDLWCCDDQCLTAYLVGGITHLFNDTQWRTFDLNGCTMSRYDIVKQFDDQKTNYVGKLAWASDFTTRQVKSHFNMQGDAAIKLMYRTAGWAFGVGYNVYGRSTESITPLIDDCHTQTAYGIKGTTGVCVKCASTFPPTTPSLNATQSGACVSKGAQAASVIVDNRQNLFPFCNTWNDQGVENSVNPIALNPLTDINYQGAQRQITHKVFGHIDYQWDQSCQQPYIGIGGECEFAQNGSCAACTANQWGIWLHGGLTF